MIFVLGLDAATWTVIKPNLDTLPNFRKLCQIGMCSDLIITEKPVSPSIWCGMFSGKTFAEHGHDSFVVDDNIVKRDDINLDFIWDILQRQGKRAVALNVPFVVPPYCFGVDYKPVGFGLPLNDREWQAELDSITALSRDLLAQQPDLLIAVYTLLDRVQHLYWGEDCVLDWYKKIDASIGRLIFDSRFLDTEKNKLIVVSDHGFCSFGDAKAQTLPKETTSAVIKGDHHENALLITVNIGLEIGRPQDIFHVIKQLIGTRI